jgi:hypothetical protein
MQHWERQTKSLSNGKERDALRLIRFLEGGSLTTFQNKFEPNANDMLAAQ